MPTPIVVEPMDRRLARLQKALGVTADGILGPETLTALEARILPKKQFDSTPFSLEVSRLGLDLLVRFEVSSKAFYEKFLRHPVWPGGESGITIGIGYDIGVTSRKQIEHDWRGSIADAAVDRLLAAQGIRGLSARKLARALSDLDVPLDVAQVVFYRGTVPLFAARTLATYPRVDELPADAQAMLLSLVYNRGTSLSGPRRRHMAALKPLIAEGVANLGAIAEQFDLMTELWPDLPGLGARRRKEAAVIRESDRSYDEDELIRV
jgi:hypothetical protein